MSWLDAFNSESNTVNETADFDSGSSLQGSDGNNIYGFSGVTAGGNLTISPTDQGAIESGYNIAAGSLDALATVTQRTVALADEVNTKSYDFAEENLNYTGQLISFIGDGVKKELDDNRIFTAGTIQHVTETVTSAADAALLFVDEQNDDFKEALIQSTERALQTADGALASNQAITDKAFTFAGEGVSKALDSISQFASSVLNSVNTQASNNIEAVTQATRSDAANSLDKVVQVAGFGIVALALAAAFVGRR